MDFTLDDHGTPLEYLAAWPRRSRRDQDGEDRLQDAALAYIAHPGVLADGTPVPDPAGFLVALAYGKARNELKRLAKARRAADKAAKEQPKATHVALSLTAALSSVGIRPGRVDLKLARAVLAGHTVREIAERLGRSVGDVHRSVAKLRDTANRVQGVTRTSRATAATVASMPVDFRAMARLADAAAKHDIAWDRHVRLVESRGVLVFAIEDGNGNRIGRTHKSAAQAARLVASGSGRIYWHAE